MLRFLVGTDKSSNAWPSIYQKSSTIRLEKGENIYGDFIEIRDISFPFRFQLKSRINIRIRGVSRFLLNEKAVENLNFNREIKEKLLQSPKWSFGRW